ncbi:MAG: ABC transporter ATP-binding protein [Solirubrobacterales bacterium]|nr:ABC transporter ATP-binding protein [Solirubrobacterales bacterium]
MSRVEFSALEMRFGDVVALESLDMVVEDGQFLVLLGPSGCGKTTALRILAGLEAPSSGRVLLGETDVTKHQPRDRDIAMVFQNYALYPHMSVAENVGYPLKVRDVEPKERDAAIERVAGLLDIGQLLGRRPRQLSGGQRQRVALARAIVREPAVFLMDEPLSNLDARLRMVMRGEIKRLQKELATTTLYVTHDQVEAMTMADRVAVLCDGRLEQLGSPDEIYDRPANKFVAEFVGSPPMNVLPGEVVRDSGSFRVAGGDVALGDRCLAACLEEEAVDIGVRPEDLHLVEPGRDGALAGEIYVVEPMGNETIVEVALGEVRVRVRTERGFRARIESPVGVAVTGDAACFFAADGRTVVQRNDMPSRERAGVL